MQDYSIVGRFWVKKNGKNFLGDGRVELLRKIHASGSISKAAKEMKMSYKAAWDDVDAMNNLAQIPLVTSATGGKKGGGTKLTDTGVELIYFYDRLKEYFEDFIENTQYPYNKELANIAGRQNTFHGKMQSFVAVGRNMKISIVTEDEMEFTALLPAQNFKKSKTKDIIVRIYPASLTLVHPQYVQYMGAANVLKGTVKDIKTADGEAQVALSLPAGGELIVNTSEYTCNALELAIGDVYCAICKENDIVLLPSVSLQK